MGHRLDILMAVYNSADYIVDQLTSLINQTYPHFRVIIRDDCSSDQSTSLIENFISLYPEKFLLIKGKRNLGACHNFATLMRYARAPYIMFCDADDVWLPTKIEESLTLMQKNEKIYGDTVPLLVHTDLAVVDKQLQSLNRSFWAFSKIQPCSANFLNRLLAQNVLTGCTLLVNQPLLQLAMPIPKRAIMHDWWIGLVASVFGRIDFIDKPTILYRQHGKNDVGAKNWKKLSTYWEYIKKFLSFSGRGDLRYRVMRTIHQASSFMQHYGPWLNSEKQRLIQNYVALGTSSILKRRYLFLRYRYFKNGFSKNIGMFFLL